MVWKIVKGVVVLSVVFIVFMLYREAENCRGYDEQRKVLEVELEGSKYVQIRAAKELCKQHIELMLTSRQIGFSSTKAYHQGATQLYRDVRVGVYGTEGGQFKMPEMSLTCLTDLQSTQVLEVQKSNEIFVTTNQTDEDANLNSSIWSLKLGATACNSNPFYSNR